MTNSLDVVTVQVDDEGAVVVRMVVRPQPGLPLSRAPLAMAAA